MPTSFFLLPRTPKEPVERIESKIEDCKRLLEDTTSLEKVNFLSRLQGRINEFKAELNGSKLKESNEKAFILEQYTRFANTLHSCLQKPQHAERYIGNYLVNKYYPVGVHNIEKPDPIWQELADYGIIMGASLLGVSLTAFILFSAPISGAILLVLAATILFPSVFYSLLPDSPNVEMKKQEEKALFQMGARIVDPQVSFEEIKTFHPYLLSDVSVPFTM